LKITPGNSAADEKNGEKEKIKIRKTKGVDKSENSVII